MVGKLEDEIAVSNMVTMNFPHEIFVCFKSGLFQKFFFKKCFIQARFLLLFKVSPRPTSRGRSADTGSRS